MNMRPDPLRLRDPAARQLAARQIAAPDAGSASPLPPSESAPLHDARALTKGGVQARIALDGQVYALRITRAGKLILTK